MVDDNLRSRLSLNGKKLIEDEYNWNKNSLLVENVYKKLVH